MHERKNLVATTPEGGLATDSKTHADDVPLPAGTGDESRECPETFCDPDVILSLGARRRIDELLLGLDARCALPPAAEAHYIETLERGARLREGIAASADLAGWLFNKVVEPAVDKVFAADAVLAGAAPPRTEFIVARPLDIELAWSLRDACLNKPLVATELGSRDEAHEDEAPLRAAQRSTLAPLLSTILRTGAFPPLVDAAKGRLASKRSKSGRYDRHPGMAAVLRDLARAVERIDGERLQPDTIKKAIARHRGK